METLKYIWSLATDIIINGAMLGAIFIFVARLFGKNLIELWFKKKNQVFQAEIDRKNREIQSNLDKQLEQLKI